MFYQSTSRCRCWGAGGSAGTIIGAANVASKAGSLLLKEDTAVAGGVVDPAVAGALTPGQMQRAMAFRVKYRVSCDKERLQVLHMGVHMMNRGPP